MSALRRARLMVAAMCLSLVGAALAASPASAENRTETTGPEATNKTFADYRNAGEPLGPELQPGTTVEISCRVQGLTVGGNDWWYRIASAPWNGNFYATADGFYNNGATEGSLHGTPPVDTAIPLCDASADVPAPSISAGTIINGVDVGAPQNERHAWGKCTIRNFDGGPNGPIIVDYTYGTHVVRNGMLQGWLKEGGPDFGCAKSDEYAPKILNGAKAQKFSEPNGRFLYWAKGMDAGKAGVPLAAFSMRWAKRSLTFSYEGENRYYGNAWQAAKNWTDAVPGLSIEAAMPGTTGDIVFRDVGWLPNLAAGRAEIPGGLNDFAQVEGSFGSPPRIYVSVSWEGLALMGDEDRTFVLTHELGHALGLAHPRAELLEQLGMKSIMRQHEGGYDAYKQGFNKPQEFDILVIKELYGLPI